MAIDRAEEPLPKAVAPNEFPETVTSRHRWSLAVWLFNKIVVDVEGKTLTWNCIADDRVINSPMLLQRTGIISKRLGGLNDKSI